MFFCFYPIHANAPSSLADDETGSKVSQRSDTPHEATAAIDQVKNEPNKPQPQPIDKNDASIQLPTTGQSAAATEDEPQQVDQTSPEEVTGSNEGLTPSPPASAEPIPDSTNQLIKRVEGIHNMVGITFDDGPVPQMTEQYLAVLDKLNVRATFFMIGQRIKYYPELARQVVEQGSEIGSHSWQHDRLDQTTADTIAKDLLSVANQVQADVGRSLSLFRPPYGRRSDTLLTVAEQLSFKVIIWDVDPRDWEDPPPEKIVASILEQVKPGSIIVMHEGHPNTLKALPDIIQKLRERGLEPVPVSEMLNHNQAQLDSNSTIGGN